jgi:hypothetical protein
MLQRNEAAKGSNKRFWMRFLCQFKRRHGRWPHPSISTFSERAHGSFCILARALGSLFRLGSFARVEMMQAADFWNLDHMTEPGRLDRSADRRIFFERQMRTAPPVVFVACDSCIPSFKSFPWMRGAPQRGLARVIFRMRFRTSGDTVGQPSQHRPFHLQ